jgi:hypothetical protein
MSYDQEISFRLSLYLGNDTMRTPGDIATALRDAANEIDQTSGLWDLSMYQNIRDKNGNVCGKYAIKNQEGDIPAIHHLQAIQSGTEW